MEGVIARILEKARRQLLNANYHTIKSSSRDYIQFWIKHASKDPIKVAVDRAFEGEDLPKEDMYDELYASLKFRLYAGILTTPVVYPESPQGGRCKNMVYDPERDAFYCKVDSNQDQADNWHEVFGYSPSCPFYEPAMENPANERGTGKYENELDKLLYENDNDLDEALRTLGLGKNND